MVTEIEIYHNMRWSRYKARVFSSLHRIAKDTGEKIGFTQIADTSGERQSLSAVELHYHQYPHVLLFRGSYDQVPVSKLVTTLFWKTFRSDAALILIPGYDRPEYWAMLVAARLRGKACGVFCDSTLYDRPQLLIKGILKRLFFSHCDVLFGYGKRSRELLLHYGAEAEKIFYRIQAAALPLSYSIAEAYANRIQHAPPAASPRFVYVGRLAPEKGLDTLLMAFHQVRTKMPSAVLQLVGSGPLDDELRRQSDALGLGDGVTFLGSMAPDALGEIYGRATCLVLPSRSEPWGLVVNEALHYGCPVVVSDRCGCVPELVVEGRTGFTFMTDDVDDLAKKMLLSTTRFNDAGLIADYCLDLISQYTPDAAARQILIGCRITLNNRLRSP